MNFCACCWLKGSISDGQVGQWWSSMARRLSFLSLESIFKLLAQKASLLRKTGKASAKLLPMSMLSIFDKSASMRGSLSIPNSGGNLFCEIISSPCKWFHKKLHFCSWTLFKCAATFDCLWDKKERKFWWFFYTWTFPSDTRWGPQCVHRLLFSCLCGFHQESNLEFQGDSSSGVELLAAIIEVWLKAAGAFLSK